MSKAFHELSALHQIAALFKKRLGGDGCFHVDSGSNEPGAVFDFSGEEGCDPLSLEILMYIQTVEMIGAIPVCKSHDLAVLFGNKRVL